MKKALITVVLLSTPNVSGCMQHSSLEKDQRPQNWGTLISNTHNFYQISSDVFRSEQPSIDLIPSLEAYQINTIINLRARNEDAKVLKDQPFNLVHIPIS